MNFENIIDLPHFHEKGRPFMSSVDRAAQFMPFKSLNGYHEIIDEGAEEVFSDVWEDVEWGSDV